MNWIIAVQKGLESMTETTINLTVIGDRACSTTRTYLEYLRRVGLRPRRLWLVDFGPVSRRLRWARRLLGARFADAFLRSRDEAAAPPDKTFAALCLRLQDEAGLVPVDYFAPWEPADYAEDVECFSATDFHDPLLQRRILRSDETAFLHTNGGIVPDMRGSDCLLWSALVRRRLGVSCFYMSPGIDEGEVIGQRELDLPRLPSLAPFLSPQDEHTAYRALLFALDPHLRTQMLVDGLRAHPGVDLRRLPTRAQPPVSRPAYLWMHPRLRLKVMREAFQ
jgi:hypothetical protein